MKNLKKGLSLLLALVMVMSLFVLGTSAADVEFTDADEITNTEAAEVACRQALELAPQEERLRQNLALFEQLRT